VDALIAAATAQTVNRRVINVGSGQEASVKQVAALIGEVTRREVEPIFSQAEGGGVSRMRADISLAAEKLNFHPKVNLAEGLHLTLERDPRFGGGRAN